MTAPSAVRWEIRGGLGTFVLAPKVSQSASPKTAVKGAAEKRYGGGADEGDKPLAALKDAEGAGRSSEAIIRVISLPGADLRI